MPHNAVLKTEQFTDIQVVDRTHPAIIKGKKFLAAQGEIPRGRIVANNVGGDVVSYDPLDNTLTICGVLTEVIDTAAEEVGPVLVHGCVVADNLTVTGGAATATETTALEALAVYPI